MTTVTSPCSTDASYTKDTITLTVPKACETMTSAGQSAVQYPSGWIWSQTYSGHGSYYLAQPTAVPQTDSGSDSTQPSKVVPVVRPETISEEGKASVKATDRPQKATGEPSSQSGSDSYDHPEASASKPTTAPHYEQVPAKESNSLEAPSSWTTHLSNPDASASASKTGSTGETAQSNVPSQSGGKGSTPMTISGASRPRCVAWAVVGLALMLY
ncbi:related to proteoglycan [Fusarium fujikuroi]|nr:related to proteoglycan [Fusarium fujikuroi]